MNNIDWNNAPEGAEFYACGCFRKDGFFFGTAWLPTLVTREQCKDYYSDYCERPQTQPRPKYEHGIEYPTNGQKPDLPDDVLVDVEYRGLWRDTKLVSVGDWDWKDAITAFRIVDERYKQKPPVSAQEALNKYSRQIVGLDGKTCQIDVYRVLAAFEVDSHPVAHAVKKLLAPGMRHAKSREQDLREAIASIEAELLMMEQGK